MITFDYSKIIKALDGPLYIYAKIAQMPTCGCLFDPTSLVNVIIKENIFMKILQHDSYDTPDVWIKTYNSFMYPSFGSIDLLV